MSELTSAASAAAIQEELAFHRFMLTTVDADDEEAEARIAELKGTIAHLLGLLEEKKNSLDKRRSARVTSEGEEEMSPPDSIPSRSRALPDEAWAEVSDLPSQRERKRVSRGSLDQELGQPSSKAVRAGWRENEDDEGMLGVDDPFLQSQMEMQERLRAEEADRRLAEEMSRSSVSFGASQGSQGAQRTTQAFLDRTGAYRRPIAPAPARPPTAVAGGSLLLDPRYQTPSSMERRSKSESAYGEPPGGIPIKSERPTINHAARPPLHSKHSQQHIKPATTSRLSQQDIKPPTANPYRADAYDINSSSDSDGIAEITQDEFSRISRSNSRDPRRSLSSTREGLKPAMENKKARSMAELREALQRSRSHVQPHHYGGMMMADGGQRPTQPQTHPQSHLGSHVTSSTGPHSMGGWSVPYEGTPTPQFLQFLQARELTKPPHLRNPHIMAGLPGPSFQQMQRNAYDNYYAAANRAGSSSAVRPWMNQAIEYAGAAVRGIGDAMWSRFSERSLDPYPGNDLDDDDDSDLEITGARQTFNLDRTLHERGLTHLLNDPAQDREELHKLLETIRPDEDLPEDMMQDSPAELAAPLMAHQRLGLAWLQQQEQGSNKGSILADDMGLGKTIQALALILTRPSSDRAMKTTLILAPVALLKQWQREIQNKVRASHALRSYIFHGQAKKKLTFAALSNYDIVLTTFGTVASEYKRWCQLRPDIRSSDSPVQQENLPLLGENSKWYRIIIDEAQCIKNQSTAAARAACVLKAEYRLCMSGTPMMNGVGEMYSLIRFLKIKPYSDKTKFQKDFGTPLKKQLGSPQAEAAMKAFQVLLKAILLRRTKKSKIDGKPILQLKPRTTEVVHAVFDEEQRDVYDHLEKATQLKFNRYLQAGTVLKSYSHILTLLLRLRQCCDHPDLIKDQGGNGNEHISGDDMAKLATSFKDEVVTMIKGTDGNFECPICYDASENPTIFFPCGHDVCSECFAKLTDPSQGIARGDESVRAKCPECRMDIDPKKVINYTIFKKVHEPEKYAAEEGAKEAAEGANGDTDSSDDDEDDDDDDANSQGDLRDFIVRDDADDDSSPSDNDADNNDNLVNEDEETPINHRIKPEPTSKPASIRDRKGKSKKTPSQKRPKLTLAELKKAASRNTAAKKRYLRRLRRNYHSSAKVSKTLEILSSIRPTGEKTLIFSLWTSMLDILEIPIDDAGYKYRRYDGSLSAALRDQAVADFTDDPDVTVMLVSLKAGNAGLNLTAASQVIILDPFWNPFTEEQAIDRAHRIGQTRDVRVHRILVQGTVEDRIEKIKEDKRGLIEAALDEGAARDLGRLNVQQLRFLFGVN